MLEIAPEKIAHVILRARTFETKVGSWEDRGANNSDAGSDSVLEDVGRDPVQAELIAFIEGLNIDEQVSLVATMWIGRGTYEAEDLQEAMETARSERVNLTSSYLLGTPMLSDYLEEGLTKLGFSIEDSEGDLM